MTNNIYVIGHKSPDTDSVVAAITYANLKNKLTGTDNYIAAIAGEINKATEFVLEKFGFNKPELLENAQDKAVILVDHNEESQRAEGDNTMIMEIVDHHKVNFSYAEPISIIINPIGSTTSIIYGLYKAHNITIDKNMAGLMLSAVLDDTVITKSPTCTEIDKTIIKELSELAGIDNWQEFGLEMFKVKASVSEKSAEEIIKLDYKDYEFTQGKIGAGQVETVDLAEFESRKEELLEEMKKLHIAENYHSIVLMITDIIKEGSLVLVVTNDQDKMNKALEHKLENDSVYIEGLLSRKKQLIPNLTDVFDK